MTFRQPLLVSNLGSLQRCKARTNPDDNVASPLAHVLLCMLRWRYHSVLTLALLVPLICCTHLIAASNSTSSIAMACVNVQELLDTVQKMSAPGKGLLAADESTATVGKRVRLFTWCFGNVKAPMRHTEGSLHAAGGHQPGKHRGQPAGPSRVPFHGPWH